MKNITFLALLIGGLISGCRPDYTKISDNLKQVRVGMSSEEVQSLLGHPPYKIGETWIYIDSPTSSRLPALKFDLKTDRLIKIETISSDEVF
jgi:outer membrane protein assembly factor BamE (lipoprotein component of BamABCDE complex)